MNVRRGILALGLLVIAAGLAFVAITEVGDAARPLFIGLALLPLVPAALLFLRRRVGSLLAIGGGFDGVFTAVAIGVPAGFAGRPVSPVLNVVGYLGLAVMAFAVIDLVLLVRSRRTSAS